MARDKERSINPAQQQRKLEKAKALKKSRAEVQTRRNEKLAKRNPERIQRQIDDLKSLEARGDIKPREKAILEDLERDLRAVKKAREAVGDNGPPPNSRGQDGNQREGGTPVLGKRRYDGERKYPVRQDRRESSGSDTDDSVRRIPMPEDTPPPILREFRRFYNNPTQQQQETTSETHNGPPRRPPVVVESKTTYSSAPQIRDLKKEAVSRFVPTVVRQKQDAVKGVGGQLVEPEELDRLEAAGYGDRQSNRNDNVDDDLPNDATNQSDDNDEEIARKLAEEEKRFEQELAMTAADAAVQGNDGGFGMTSQTSSRSKPPRTVQMEEIEDEDG